MLRHVLPVLMLHAASSSGNGITTGDWTAMAVGALIGIAGMSLAAFIAWKQRVIQIMDRQADRRLQAQAEAEQTAKVNHRSAWEPEYLDMRQLLKDGDVIAWKIMNNGPFGADELKRLGLENFSMQSEHLADRGVDALRGDMRKLADLAAVIMSHPLPSSAAMAAACAASAKKPTDGMPQLRALCRTAIEQDRGAQDLAESIDSSMKHLRREWGGDHENGSSI